MKTKTLVILAAALQIAAFASSSSACVVCNAQKACVGAIVGGNSCIVYNDGGLQCAADSGCGTWMQCPGPQCVDFQDFRAPGNVNDLIGAPSNSVLTQPAPSNHLSCDNLLSSGRSGIMTVIQQERQLAR